MTPKHATTRAQVPPVTLNTPVAGKVALKGFFSIMEKWHVTPDQMRVLLGAVGKGTLYRYQKLPELTLSRDLLERISYILGIYKALRILFPTDERASEWVKKPNSAAPLNGHSALEWMLQGRVTDLADVRRYLDAQRG